jgi:hypothetical protein
VGQDTRTPVAALEYHYDVPFKFTGKIDKLTFKLEPAHRWFDRRFTVAGGRASRSSVNPSRSRLARHRAR